MVTVAQLKELNGKIDRLKEQNSAAIAELKVLQGQLDTKAKALSEMLGVAVTADNIETLYMQAQQQLEEKAKKIEELLADLQGAQGAQGTPNMNFGAPFGFTGQPNGFTPTLQAAPTAPTAQGFGQAPANNGQAVAPSFENFATGSVFQI